MPATNGLQPPLTAGEKKVVKAYGNWTDFMHCFGPKPYNDDDCQEGKAIARTMAAHDEEEAKGSTGER